MPHRHEDATGWIGYADFLTTLTALFFAAAVAMRAKLPPSGSGVVVGRVVDVDTKGQIGDCLAKLGESRQTRTTTDGDFEFRLDSIAGRLTIGMQVTCTNYGAYSEPVQVRANDTTRVDIRLKRDTSLVIRTLPGDALFASGDYVLRPEAVRMIDSLGRSLEAQLGARDVILVQGHTDDVPYSAGAGTDNWVLSGQRAAAAAKVLIDRVGVPECRVAIMGRGPSQPVDTVHAGDSRWVAAAKRRRNRRIEFMLVSGSGLVRAGCDG